MGAGTNLYPLDPFAGPALAFPGKASAAGPEVERVIETAYNNWQTGKEREGWVYQIRSNEKGGWIWRGPFPTEPAAVRAARCALLEVKLVERTDGRWRLYHRGREVDDDYETADAALHAACLARGQEVGHHIDAQGRFQSDRHPDLPPDKIVLSFRDPAARRALRVFAAVTADHELAVDVLDRVQRIERER